MTLHIQTVTGPVSPDDLGFTLPAEHFYMQQWEATGHASSWQLEDDDVFADEIAAFQAVGGTCIVDQTPACVGRKPEKLADLSRRSGLAIVMGCGWYTEAYAPPEEALEKRSAGSVAEGLIREIEEGVDGSRIRPGIIGEFGPQRSYISPLEERIHRASARASVQTGLALGTHALHSEVGLAQLDLFEEERVDPGRVAIGHCDSHPHLDYWLKIIERGAYVQVDNVGTIMGRHEERIAALIRDLVSRGHEERILLSHDVGVVPELRYHGGRGFTYLSEAFLPRLHALGIPDDVLTTITSDNPRRFLTVP